MTPLPKKKQTKRSSAARKLVLKIKGGSLVVCKSCGKLKLPHKACPACGYYREE